MMLAYKNIVETYSMLFEGLDSFTKKELILRLSESLKYESDIKEKAFFKSFGAFPSNKSAEVITTEIRNARKFK